MKAPVGRALASAALTTLLFAALPSAAQQRGGGRILRHEFSCERERRPGVGLSPVLTPTEIADRLRKEAAWVYMGMIYGFEVDYVPLDVARKVHESFTAVPAWDPKTDRAALRLSSGRIDGAIMKIYVEYPLNSIEVSRYDAWRRGGYAPFQADGRAAESSGPEARFTAMEQSIKAAVKEYARSLEQNRPRRVRAIAAFERPPILMVDAGLYVARARVRIKVLEIVPYPDL